VPIKPPPPGKPAAKQGDRVVGVDTHIVMIPSPGGPIPTPMPMPFSGQLDGALSSTVVIDDQPAATKGSTASNTPHVPAGGPFQKPPADEGTVETGSSTVLIDDQPAAYLGSTVVTCNDPADLPVGTVVATSTVVMVGG
jgi:uncharacterized Zn-binding protein involved in type VI secretion